MTKNKIEFIDLKYQQSLILDEIKTSIANVLDHGKYIMGPEVKIFEEELCKFSGAKHSITCANGTDAISLAMMAMEIGAGDTVIVPSFTYVASAEAPALLGVNPFFVDVRQDTFNIDIDDLKNGIIKCKKNNLNLKALVVVDLFGQPAEIEEIHNIARENNLKIIVDAAQSFGASINDIKVGNFGDITTTSFFPAKPLGCYGDGGAVIVNDDDLAEKISSIRLHGKGSQKYDNVRVGMNSRLDTFQAAILIEKIKLFRKELELRNDVANFYNENLNEKVIKPKIINSYSSAWAQYTLQVEDREKYINILSNHEIPSVIYYPIPLHLQKGYASYNSNECKVSEKLSKSVFSLPMHPYLDKKKQEYICEIVNSI